MTSDILYNRLLLFAQDNQKLVKKLSKTIYNIEYGSQLIRSSSSPGANYIEAIEASSRKDFIYRLKVSKKEIKESCHWLMLIQSANDNKREIFEESGRLIREAYELIKIFSSSIQTSERNLQIKNSK